MSEQQIITATNAAIRAWSASLTSMSYSDWVVVQKALFGAYWGAKEVL